MFEPFSRGYYLGRLTVAPHGGERALMQRDQHERVNAQLYTTGEGVERTDFPLVMKVDTSHLSVLGEPGVPEDTLAVPESLLSELGVRNPPTLRTVLLATADRAAQLLRLSGGARGADDAGVPGVDDEPPDRDGGDGPASTGV
jgi:hypothetical protein